MQSQASVSATRSAPKVRASVVVVTWNGEPLLQDCLNAILAQTGPDDEVIVVDNKSADGSAALVRERYPGVHLIENERNLGFAGGCNVGLQAARGEYLLLVSQDVTVHAGWLEAMLKALAPPQVGIAGCKLVDPDGIAQHAGGAIGYPLAHIDFHSLREPDDERQDRQREVGCVTAAAMGLKPAVLEKIGLLDDRFFPAFYEDVDLCMRARAGGFQVIYTPDGVGTHHDTATPDRQGIEYHRWLGRGRLRFALKHYTPEQFYNDFVSTEGAWLASLPGPEMRQGLRMAYLDALLGLRDMPRTGVLASDGSDEAVAEALIGLRSILVAFPEKSSGAAPAPEFLVELPWGAQAAVSKWERSFLGRAIARLRGLLNSVWRLQQKLAVVQEVLVGLDREMTEGRRQQAEAVYGLERDVDCLRKRVRILEEASSAPSEGDGQ